jgi:hypothetical protein
MNFFFNSFNKGTGQSKLVEEDNIYTSNPIQKVSILHSFLKEVLPNRTR